MSTVAAMARRVRDLQSRLSEVVEDSVSQTSDEYLKLNKEQLMEGYGSDGASLRPGYSEDPYFKSLESAAKYAKWKMEITPNPRRSPDAPNLYITGKYHASLGITVGVEKITLTTNFDGADDINKKYQGKHLGLGGFKKLEYLGVLAPVFRAKITDVTGLKFS
ncbi:hypothetical protein [Chitinophaga sp. YIM B06452]|uniref:hypothetical protein n=1 Tax=Chitinophaga sp. YIM B06452 TaxID=3082158 RepID=UPI0031FE4D66